MSLWEGTREWVEENIATKSLSFHVIAACFIYTTQSALPLDEIHLMIDLISLIVCSVQSTE